MRAFFSSSGPIQLNLVRRKHTHRRKNPAISPEQLAQASVAVQGLPAMEYLLFDEAIAKVRRCRWQQTSVPYPTGTAANLEANAGQLEPLVGRFGKRCVSPELEKSHPGYFCHQRGKSCSSSLITFAGNDDRNWGRAWASRRIAVSNPRRGNIASGQIASRQRFR